MKRLSLAISLAAVLCQFTTLAQVNDTAGERQTAIAQARYLRSIYKTDQAINILSGLTSPERIDEEVLNELAECHIQAGEYESAASTYNMLSLLNPDNILYKIRLTNIAYRLKDYLSSAELGKSVIQMDSIPAIISLTADSYNLLEMTDSALAYYGLYMRLKPESPKIISKAAKIHLGREEYDTVIDMTDAYLQIDSADMDMRGLKGLAYYLKQDYRKSEKVFQKMADDGNDSYNVHFYLGQNLWHNNRHLAAKKELEAAWQIDSSDVNLAYTIGAVSLECGMGIAKAGLWFDKAIDMLSPDPTVLARIYREYGSGYMNSSQYRPALDYYFKSWELDKNKYSVLLSIGFCYEKLKNWKMAEQYYELYLESGKPGSSGYKFTKESLDYVRQQLFMEE